MKTKTKKINSKKYFASLFQRRKKRQIKNSPLFLSSFKIVKATPVKFVTLDNESLYTKFNWLDDESLCTKFNWCEAF